MGSIKNILSVSLIDRALEKINWYKSLVTREPVHRNKGLCHIFDLVLSIDSEEESDSRIVEIVDYLCELDGIEPPEMGYYVYKWGMNQVIDSSKWYEKRIEILLKARGLLTNEYTEDYV